MNIGIVGLPNAGKSTIFNALIQHIKAEVASYPFCTIEPNIGKAGIPDERLFKIAEFEKSEKVIPATIEFVDIAGLVRGAGHGEGMGNQFLSYIRGVSAIAHVIRCFENPEIPHVEGSIDPVRDAEIVNIELIIADIQTVEKRLLKIEKLAKSGNLQAKKELSILKKAKKILEEEIKPIRLYIKEFDEEEIRYLEKELFLLTIKPVMYIANISEESLPEGENSKFVKTLKEFAEKEGSPVVTICGKFEQELAELDPEEKEEFLKEMELEEPGLNKLVKEGKKLLNLVSFFTTKSNEARAWLVKKGTKAPKAAGKIHSDMEKGFICAEVINYEDYIKIGSFQKARELGAVRTEGKDYEIKDGDIVLFKFNV